MERIAIIGAGLAGLTAAAKLADSGHAVTIFEKSRGTGGRLATRRGDAGAFDHGAPRAEGGSAFDAEMERLGAERFSTGWRGTPGMSALVKPLAQGLDLRRETRITAARHDGAWHLEAENGAVHGPFSGLISAIPAPQAAQLFPEAGLERVRMAPRWTLMVRWAGLDPKALPQGIAEIVPQREEGLFVVHADCDWSARHLEYEAAQVAADLVNLLAPHAEGRPEHTAAHRWRYALTAHPLGAPFAEVGPNAIAGGDWALGAKAGAAWRSGRAMGEAALGFAARER